MNDEVKERFKSTFEAIRESFKMTFKQMFGGGSADLILTEMCIRDSNKRDRKKGERYEENISCR